MSVRDDFSQAVKQALALRVGNHCSRPACRALTSGPHQKHADKVVNIGVAAHITAAAPGGPRFDVALTAEERASAENGIWLCQNCAKLVDSDTERFAIEELLEWKRQAENSAKFRLGRTAAPLAIEAPHTTSRPLGTHRPLIVLGPYVIAEGWRVAVAQDSWVLRLERFLFGDDAALSRVGDPLSGVPADEHFVVLNEPDDARAVSHSVSWIRHPDYYEVHVPVAAPWLPRTVRYRESIDLETMREVQGVPAGATTIQCWLGQGVGHFGVEDRVGSWLPKWWLVESLVEHRNDLTRMEIVRLARIPRLMNEYTGEVFAPLDFVERVISVSVSPGVNEENLTTARIELMMSGADDSWSDTIILATEIPDIDGIMAQLTRQMSMV